MLLLVTKFKFDDGDIVTFGNIVSSDTLVSGDELLCDVDGTGYNKKFYYMRTLNDNAVLLYDSIIVADNDPDYTNYVYDTAKTILPDTSTWSNLPVTFGGGITMENGVLLLSPE